MLTRFGNSTDISDILLLQEHNLYGNLSEQQYSSGFVTTPFSVAQLESLIADDGVFVAVSDAKLVGYLLAGTWQYYSAWPIFPYMVSRFPLPGPQGKTITADNSFQYGPICIAQDHRGTSVFPALFECMRIHFSRRFPIGYTFINRVNQRSYVAHTRKLGLQVFDQFEFGGNSFYGLAFDTKQSVIDSHTPDGLEPSGRSGNGS